ncbi:MAG: TolC family outer membrane protein [Proteobacteria bacterium]|nr:TolC family outer membrane protein [Pseudomonadota bacterium]
MPAARPCLPALRLPCPTGSPLHVLSLAAAAVVLAAAAPAASAQSLKELYDAAHAYDAAYLSVRAQAESVGYRAEQTYALMRPSASLDASAGYADARYPGFGTEGGKATSVTLQGKQPIYNPANRASIKQAERSIESAGADLRIAEQDLILRITQAYFDVLNAQDTLATTRANKTAIAEQLASAKRNFEVGTATITDTREAQARYDLATSQEVVADNDLLTKRIALDQLVGRKDVAPKQLAVPVALPAVPGTVDDWVGRAEATHPKVMQAQIAYDTAQLETEKARAGHYPTLDATANYNSQYGSQQGLVGTTTSRSIGLQVNVPLFSGFSVQNAIREKLKLEEKAREDLDATRRSVSQTTRQAYFTLRSGLAQVKALEAAESSSQLALEATQVGYKVGVRVNIDVLNAQTQLYTTQRDLAKARYDVLVGNLQLRQAAGQLTSSDLDAINRLLAP